MQPLCLFLDSLRPYRPLYELLIAISAFRRKLMDHAVRSCEAVDDLPFDLLVQTVKPSHPIDAADRAALHLTPDFDLRKVILAITGKHDLFLFLLFRHFIQRLHEAAALRHFLRELVDMAAGVAAGSHLEVVIVNIATDEILPVIVGIGHSHPAAIRQPEAFLAMLIQETDPALCLPHMGIQHILPIAVTIHIRKILIPFTRQAIPLAAHIGIAVKSTLRRCQLAVILDRHGAHVGLDFPIMGAVEEREKIYNKRMEIYEYYHRNLAHLAAEGKIEQPFVPEECIHNAHMYYIKVHDMEVRTRLIRYLREKGICSVFHYVPLHSAPAGIKYGRFAGEDVYTTKESERLVRLPMFYNLDMEDVKYVTDTIDQFDGF